MLKLKIVGLATLERARKRQSSRVTWLRAGDARTAFFQAKLCSRRWKNFIQSIEHNGAHATTHEDKERIVKEHFEQLLSSYEDAINLPRVQNQGLDNPFTKEEVWAAVCASLAEKAPGRTASPTHPSERAGKLSKATSWQSSTSSTALPPVIFKPSTRPSSRCCPRRTVHPR